MRSAVILLSLILAACSVEEPAEDQFRNPLLDGGPDPYAFFHEDGYFYYTHTLGNRLDLWRTRDITDLRNAER